MESENNEIIVSLTSISSRKKILIYTIESLLNQETEYKYIILLNLSYESFLLDDGFSENDIISIKEKFNNPKLKINICKNIGSLRKIVPALQIYKNNIIITVDDDTIYNKHMIQRYVNQFKKHNCIISSRIRMFMWHSNGTEMLKTRVTELVMLSKPMMRHYGMDNKQIYVYPEGVGGILYHTSFFSEKFYNYDYTNIDHFLLKNDDLIIRAFTINIPVFLVKINNKIMPPPYYISLYHNHNFSYNLYFYDYLNLFYEKLIIGSSLKNTNTKTIILNKIYPSETKLFFLHNLTDKFSYNFNDNNLTIKRIDKETYWEYELVAYLYN